MPDISLVSAVGSARVEACPPPRYPGQRPPFFAQRFIRAMVKTTVANVLGSEAFALLTVIASCEDARRYRGPVNYYNAQLMPLIGVKTWKCLDRLRQSCVDAGWLVYVGGKRGDKTPGLYWVTIPPEADGLGDTPSDGDESHPVRSEQPHPCPANRSADVPATQSERRPSPPQTDQRDIPATIIEPINGRASYPGPDPVPDPEFTTSVRTPEFERTEPTPRKTLERYSPSEISAIYEAYPRKRAPNRAFQAIAKCATSIAADELLRLTLLYAAASSSSGADPRFIPYPATWFNGGCWREDPREWQRTDSPASDKPRLEVPSQTHHPQLAATDPNWGKM